MNSFLDLYLAALAAGGTLLLGVLLLVALWRGFFGGLVQRVIGTLAAIEQQKRAGATVVSQPNPTFAR